MKIKNIASILTIFCFSFNTLAQTKSQYVPNEHIVKWEKVKIKKDFILSNSLMYHRFCRKVWKKQVPEFQKKNPHIKDVNKFEVGDVVDLQLCTDLKFVLLDDNLKQSINQSFNVLSDDTFAVISDSTPHDNPKESVASSNIFDPDFTLLLSAGGLAEQDEKTQAAFGFRVLANVRERIGYRMRLDYAPTVLMWHNELLLQTIPDNGNRYYLGYGLGNRMGLKENPNILLSNKVTGYTTVSLGSTFKAGKGQIDVQVGSNLSNHFSPFFSIMAGKKLGDTPYTLGGYIDYRSTRSSKEDTNEDRHWVGAGILFSY